MRIREYLRICGVCLYLLFLTQSCGGGTIGTTDTRYNKQIITGVIKDESNAPIQNVQISLNDSDQYFLSDPGGYFILTAKEVEPLSKLRVRIRDEESVLMYESTRADLSALSLQLVSTSQGIQSKFIELIDLNYLNSECNSAFGDLETYVLYAEATPFFISNQRQTVGVGVKCHAELLFKMDNPSDVYDFEIYYKSFTADRGTLEGIATLEGGVLRFNFVPEMENREPGYYVVEGPTYLPRQFRLSVVLNLRFN